MYVIKYDSEFFYEIMLTLITHTFEESQMI